MTLADAGEAVAMRGRPGSAQLQAGLERLREAQRTRYSVDVVARATRRDVQAGGELLAGALAMRFFALLLPFTAALLAALGLVTRSSPDTAAGALEQLGIAGTAASSMADASRLTSSSLWLVLGGSLVALFLGARTVLRVLWTVHRLAWSEPAGKPPWPWLGAGGVVVALLAMVLISFIAPVLRHGVGVGAGLLGFGAELVLFTGLWLVVASLLPHGDAPPRALLPGAAVVGVGITLLHTVTTLWAAGVVSHYNSAYGALGTAVALLLWLYLVGRLIVAAAIVNAAHWEGRAGSDGVSSVRGDDHAPAAP